MTKNINDAQNILLFKVSCHSCVGGNPEDRDACYILDSHFRGNDLCDTHRNDIFNINDLYFFVMYRDLKYILLEKGENDI